MAISTSLQYVPTLVAEGKMQPGEPITIYSDSQSALKALTATTVNSKTVLECLQTIQAVSNQHELRLE